MLKIKKNNQKPISVSSFVWEAILFSVKVQLSSPYVLSSPVLCFFLSLPLSLLWVSALFLRSQVVNKGGIQFQERSLIGWFGKFGWFSYPLSLSPSSFSLFSLSGGFSQLPRLPSLWTVWQWEKIISFLRPLSHTCFLPLVSSFPSHAAVKHDRMACICLIQTANTWHVGVSKS